VKRRLSGCWRQDAIDTALLFVTTATKILPELGFFNEAE